MSEGTGTRRAMLRTALGLAAGAVGLGTAGAAAAARPGAAPGATRFELAVDDLAGKAHGRKRGQLAQLEDQVSARGTIGGQGSGGYRGLFTSTGTVLRLPGGAQQATAEHHLFVLDGGTVTGHGLLQDGTGSFAVTGGTGRYAGARGHYEATISPAGLGGDGTARFHFTLSI